MQTYSTIILGHSLFDFPFLEVPIPKDNIKFHNYSIYFVPHSYFTYYFNKNYACHMVDHLFYPQHFMHPNIYQARILLH